jgi:hypothetical protein
VERFFRAGADGGGKCPTADRQLSTTLRKSPGLKGFWMLDTAPSLVAMCRKFGAYFDADRTS